MRAANSFAVEMLKSDTVCAHTVNDRQGWRIFRNKWKWTTNENKKIQQHNTSLACLSCMLNGLSGKDSIYYYYYCWYWLVWSMNNNNNMITTTTTTAARHKNSKKAKNAHRKKQQKYEWIGKNGKHWKQK